MKSKKLDNIKEIEKAAERLRLAKANFEPCKPIRDLIDTSDLNSAYAIQKINNDLLIESGKNAVGKKIGLTSFAVQEQLGVDQPDFGLIWEDKQIKNGEIISVKEFMQAKAEVEIAFVLKKDLKGKDLSIKHVIDAIDYASIAIEIVGSRIENWDIKIIDTIADNASASHFAISDKRVKLNALDLENCKMTLMNNGELVSEGIGKNCMDNPLNATLWLAQKMIDLNNPLLAGEIILSGALGKMASINAGDNHKANIEGLGELEISYIN